MSSTHEGKNLLEEQKHTNTTSRLWGGIRQCVPTLRRGSCFLIGTQSKVKIKDTPWINNLEGFRIPDQVTIPSQYKEIKELMEWGTTWNQLLVRSMFPPQISEHILNTLILDREHERLICTPSLSGSFSVKSTYRMMIKDRASTGQLDSWNS